MNFFQSTYREQKIAVRYNEYLNNWYISNKSQGNDNIRVTNTYGTKRINGYHLLENALNLRATKIYDTIYDENGKEQHKLNGPATEEAQAKQRMIEDAFKDWIFKDRERRESLVALYNEKFNCIRPREYDGSHIQFFRHEPGNRAAAPPAQCHCAYFCTGTTHCWRTLSAQEKPMRWSPPRWRKSDWDYAAKHLSPCQII